MDAIAIEGPHGGGELITFFPFEKELSDLLAPTLVLRGGLRFLLLLLLLVVDGPEAIFGVTGLVLGLGVFSLDFPYALFFEGKSAPTIA
jgi:hypothetical protein